MPTKNVHAAKPSVSANATPGAAPRTRRRSSVQAGARATLPDLTANVSFDTHEPIGKQIFRALRQAIFVGQMVPGTPLSEKEVSDMFQVSRQPVREAFIKLVEAGVLQVLPQRGTFVKRISPRQVREGRFIREAIETAVVRKAAVSITDAQLQALADNLRDQKLAAKSNDTAAFLALDEAFHYAIAQAIDCTAAWETIQDIKAQMDRVRYLSLPDVSPLDLLIKQHAKILAGLRAHDPAAAEDAMRRHLREILTSLGPIAERNPAWFEADEPERVPLSI
ncbi:GntR family transcriptional regulator [Paraburkholderia sp. 22099]|jgi:GntR family transcriptional regulator, rspAB operon transcriptional repressor|uniref:DNA-binding transcriptional regulator, GntR family n=1 Tax=Paraburkholderia terricola TaxID=169427 RepID=A0A1M6K5B9_9BURK|nr:MULTISPECIES: GntR family transcriptional regulator [Paraburkholderia]MDR6449359.1 DNA-binding GntR family transcriptional regulator [Paraburkholderia terricola]MDR6490440.1 DNA-binding GntR family transcriptional regulator [Paraburkholderia terricola]SDN72913.1 DNA-binding transcriptional regulator, GntR family [Paraburkholderia sediminicola]SHJ54105.1 DNA-binding transcriptional regulator, GntR family [Paraburkholderia terricola]